MWPIAEGTYKIQVSKFYSRAKPTKNHLKRTLMMVLRTKKHWSSTTICGDVLETFQVRSSQFSDFWIKLTPLSVILVILWINTVSIQFSAEIDRSHEKEGQISQSVQIVESNVIRSYCFGFLSFSSTRTVRRDKLWPRAVTWVLLNTKGLTPQSFTVFEFFQSQLLCVTFSEQL